MTSRSCNLLIAITAFIMTNLKFMLLSFFVLTSLSLPAQKIRRAHLDSLLRQAAAAKEDTNKVNLMVRVAGNYTTPQTADSAILYLQHALALAQKLKWQYGVTKVYRSFGDHYYIKKDFATAHQYLDKAFKTSLSGSNDELTGNLLSYSAAAIYYQGKNTDAAISYMLSGAERFKKMGKAKLIPGVYFEIGAYNVSRYNYSAGLEYFNKALQLEEKMPQEYLKGWEVEQIAWLYRNLHNIEKAKAVLLKAIAKYKKEGKNYDLAVAYDQLAECYTDENDHINAIIYYNKTLQIGKTINLADIPAMAENAIGWNYFLLKKYDSAYVHTKQAIALEKNDSVRLIYSLSTLGSIYREAPLSVLKKAGLKPGEQYQKSAGLLAAAIKTAEKRGLIDIANGNRGELIKTYEKMHLYQDAYQYYKKYIKEKDHIDSLKNEKDVLLKEAQLTYSHKEDSLNYRQNITNAQLKQKKQQSYFFIGGIAVLLILSGFIWLNFNNQRKANALLAEQKLQTETALNELKAAQQQLIQSEKMASLGELTAGIAHEIQNPLNFVNNFSDVNREMIAELKEALGAGDVEEALGIAADIEQNEEKIHHHGKRADGIVKGMLEHSRASTGQKEPTDINKLTDEYLRLAYHGLRAKDKSFNAKLVTRFDEKLPLINAVPQDIGRVLLNLFNNAFYAVQQKQKTAAPEYEPVIEVSTSVTGDQLQLSVKDNGTGIPDSIKEKIMQPFFTTKPAGQGTGLGLSLSYDIIGKGHSGQLIVNSTPGEGAEFIVQLPYQKV